MYTQVFSEGSERVCELCCFQYDHRASNRVTSKISFSIRFHCHLDHSTIYALFQARLQVSGLQLALG